MITTVVVAMTTVWRSDAVTPAPRATGRSPEQHDQLRASDSRDIFDKQTSQFEVARQSSCKIIYCALPGWRFSTLNEPHLTRSISSSQHDEP